jgi:site-specific recombinase XerD
MIKGYVEVVKDFFTWCYREELIEKNPAARQGHDRFSAVSAMEVLAKRKKRKKQD